VLATFAGGERTPSLAEFVKTVGGLAESRQQSLAIQDNLRHINRIGVAQVCVFALQGSQDFLSKLEMAVKMFGERRQPFGQG
jgi:hypothetical protein